MMPGAMFVSPNLVEAMELARRAVAALERIASALELEGWSWDDENGFKPPVEAHKDGSR